MEMLGTQKAELRAVIRKRLKAVPETEKRIMDRQIAERVLDLPEVAGAGMVYGYASLSLETGSEEILKELWKRNCIVCLPRVVGETMEFFVTESWKDLAEGAFHIMEPISGCRSADGIRSETAPILVPGLGFTENGLRLGKGGGYYDRYLETHAGHRTIALAYEFQILQELPAEPYDKSVDRIVTEKRVIRCRNRIYSARQTFSGLKMPYDTATRSGRNSHVDRNRTESKGNFLHPRENGDRPEE